MMTKLRIAALVMVLSVLALNGRAASLPIRNCDKVLQATQASKPARTSETLATIQKFVDFVNAHKYDTDLLPFIDPEKIEDLEYVQRVGQRNFGTYEGTLAGRNIFIKAIAFNDEIGVAEGFWFQFLNNHELGVKFLGLTRINNDWALITERVVGLNIKARIQLTQAQIKGMNDQVNKLFDLGIYPKDVQFVITEKGPVLIDPELFTTYGERNEKNRIHFLKQFNTKLQVLASGID